VVGVAELALILPYLTSADEMVAKGDVYQQIGLPDVADLLTQQSSRQCGEGGMLGMMVIDLVWSTLVSADLVSSISGVRVNLWLHSKALLACAFASAHVLVGCSAIAYFEMLMRAVLFYVLCAIVILCSQFMPPNTERSACSVLHLCAPVLFVHLYPTIASVLVLVG
jgi:hypothetical protein